MTAIDRAQQQLVSVLMPVHNGAATLRESVASVTAQSHQDWELLIVDDGSGDGTLELARGLASRDARITVLEMARNGGAAAARNYGLAQARGRYIAFLDCDDLWHPQKLSRQIAFMQQNNAAISFTAYARMGQNGRLIEEVRAAAELKYARLLKRNVMGCLTVIYDAQILGKTDMPPLTRQQDFALWLELVGRAGLAHGLDEVLAIYRVGQGTLSSNKAAAAGDIWRILRGREGLGLVRATWYFAHYAYFGLRHRLIQRADVDAPMVDTRFGNQRDGSSNSRK